MSYEDILHNHRLLTVTKTAVDADPLSISREAIGLETDGMWCDVAQFQAVVRNGDWKTAVSLTFAVYTAKPTKNKPIS